MWSRGGGLRAYMKQEDPLYTGISLFFVDYLIMKYQQDYMIEFSHIVPFIYGLMYNSIDMAYTLACVIFPAALSVFFKRCSAQKQGGYIYNYNKEMVQQGRSKRRKKILDMLNDPILVKDVSTRGITYTVYPTTIR